jgi:hypothetical protein
MFSKVSIMVYLAYCGGVIMDIGVFDLFSSPHTCRYGQNGRYGISRYMVLGSTGTAIRRYRELADSNGHWDGGWQRRRCLCPTVTAAGAADGWDKKVFTNLKSNEIERRRMLSES